MAGIGPICTNNRDLLKRAKYRSSLAIPDNELEIFCSLCVGRVLFRKSNQSLYFVDAPTLSITEIILKLFKGIKQKPQIRQLFMDEHKLIKAAYCIALTAHQKKLLIVALSINGIHIDYSN